MTETIHWPGPGREADAIVAEKVMGQEVKYIHDWIWFGESPEALTVSDKVLKIARETNAEYVCDRCLTPCQKGDHAVFDSDCSDPIPMVGIGHLSRYTADSPYGWAAMRTVVEKLQRDESNLVFAHHPLTKGWVVVINAGPESSMTRASSLPEAVCIAALRALGHEVIVDE